LDKSDIGAEEASRLQSRCKGKPGVKPGWLARRAWKRLLLSVDSGDRSALLAVCLVAADPDHAFCSEAKTLVADEWFRSRDEALLEVVVRTRSLGSSPVARLAAAAVCGVLDGTWQVGDEAALAGVLDDVDSRVSGAARTDLIGAARRRDDARSVAACRLVAGRWYQNRDPVLLSAVCLVAADPDHAFCSEAKTLVADEWFRSRDEALLEVVVRTRSLGSSPVARLAAAAVCGILQSVWDGGDEDALVYVLDDADIRVRAAARNDLYALARQHDDSKSEIARHIIADRWVQTRDPDLRNAVVETKALAREGYPRLVTLALHGNLAGPEWEPRVKDLRRLLIEKDADVLAGTRLAITEARGATADSLWTIGKAWDVKKSGQPRKWWDNGLTSLLMVSTTPPPVHVLDALWVAWLNEADTAVIGRLQSWGVAATTSESDADAASLLETGLAGRQRPPRTEALFRLAARGPHPISDRALTYISTADDNLLDQFCDLALTDQSVRSACIRGRLAPRDGTSRAVWFLLTNQPDEYRAFDADGSLLALAYTAASEDERQTLQESMRRAGGLDLVRVLVGADRRGRIQAMTAAEIDYLAGSLASRQEWSRLWGIVLDLPLSTAVPIMHHFQSTAWQPADEDSRQLFGLFCAATPDSVERALSDIRQTWPMGVHQARIHFNGPVNDVSFAPDSPVLAVAGSQRTAGLIDLRTGRLAFRFEDFNSSVGRVLHIGNSTFVAGERTNSTLNTCSVYVCHANPTNLRGSQRPLASVSGSITSLAARGESGYVAGTRSGHILICDDVDRDPRQVSMGAFGLDPDVDWPREVTISPSTGVMAILGRELLVANGRATRVVARGSSSTVIQRAVFATEDVLAVGDRSGEVTLMRLQGGSLTATYYRSHRGLGGLAAVPQRGQVIAAAREGAAVHVYSATSLERLGSLNNSRTGTARSVHASENGDLVAVGCVEGYTDIYDLRISVIPTMVTRPMVTMVPSDIARLRAGIATTRRGHVSSTLDLLLSALQHRFRFDIELADTGTLKAGDYDIALA